MLPSSLVDVDVIDARISPRFLTPRDEPWVRAAIEAHGDVVGLEAREAGPRLDAFTNEVVLSGAASFKAAMALRRVLAKDFPDSVVAAAKPRDLRRAIYTEAARQGSAAANRDATLAAVARGLGMSAHDLVRSAFADFPENQVVQAPKEMPSPQIVCERYNLALVQGLLLLAQEVEVRVREHVRAVVRLAKLRRLMCTVSEDDRGTAIELFGPLSLFRPTMKYGPSLATFFPQVVSTREWSLRARCWLSGAFASLFVSSSDPLHRAYALPQDYDSELERRLARDLRRAHPRQWTLVRESAAVRTRNGLVFPDFSLERDEHRVHVEVVGFWTPEYLARKQSELSSVVDPVMVVCVDESLGAPEGSFGRHEVVPFKRKVDAKALVAAAERVVARWTATSAR